MGWKESLVPIAAMVMVECMDVGLSTISKAAMSRGMNHYMLVVYPNALASLILLPSAFFFQRSKRPPLTFSLLSKFFLLSLAGITVMQNCAVIGVGYSSPTLSSAMSNLVPAFTFLLALIFRMEKIDLWSSTSLVKIMGTLVSIIGAMIVTLYKGPSISGSTPVVPPPSGNSSFNLSAATADTSWVLGGIFLAIAFLSLAIWTTSQAAILKEYPSELTIIAFYSLFGTVQCALVSLVAERQNPNAWILKSGIEFIAVICLAVFGSGVICFLQTWCIRKRGPVFVSIFKPLDIGIAAIFSGVFLGETLHVGSVVGAVVIVVGFYGVIWADAKREDEAKIQEIDRLPSVSHTTPLLPKTSDA